MSTSIDIAKNASARMVEQTLVDNIAFRGANSETTDLFVGPQRLDQINLGVITDALKVFSYEFLIDKRYNVGKNKWTIADNDTSNPDSTLSKIISKVRNQKVGYFFHVGAVQSANTNSTPSIQPIYVIGSPHKHPVHSDFNTQNGIGITQVKFYGYGFLQAIIANIGVFQVHPKPDIESMLVDLKGPWSNDKEFSLFQFIYRKLIGFDTMSMAFRIPFGLGMIVSSQSGEIIGVKYLENIITQALASSMRIEQPMVMNQLQFIGDKFVPLDPNQVPSLYINQISDQPTENYSNEVKETTATGNDE